MDMKTKSGHTLHNIPSIAERSLYRPEYEHDACGVGFVANIKGVRSNEVLELGLTSICNLSHRGAIDADAKTGDGAGILTQIPHKIFEREIRALGHHLYNGTSSHF